ncbi:MAG: two-component regulator propeller domain-containing protein [Vicinamibacterales bacterium]
MLTRCACLVVSLLVMAPPGVGAQSRDYLLDVWDTNRGLPSSLVTSLAQTPEGYLWVATQNGLVRFDGLRFAAFDPGNTPQLPHARVEHLFVDAGGTLWINTYDGSITSWRDGVFRTEWKGAGPHRFEALLAVSNAAEVVFVLDTGSVIRRAAGSTGAWQVIRPPGTDLVPIFAQDREGALWIKSIDEHLWRLRGGVLEPAPMRGLTGLIIQCLATDAQNRLWVGTEAEVALFEGDRFRTMTPTNGEPRIDVSLVFFTADGGHWIIGNGRARKAEGRQWVWSSDSGKGLTGPYHQALNGLEDRRGGVWFSHDGQGLLHVRTDGTSRWIRVADGLPGDRIRQVLEDREGNIWLAIDRGGLVRLRDSRFRVVTAAEGPRTAAVSSVAEGDDGSIWVGSMGGGLLRYRNGVMTKVPVPSATPSAFVFSLFPVSNGRVWMSADREDLFFFDGTRVRRSAQSVHGVKTILADRTGAVWIGTKDGLLRVDGPQRRTFGPEDGYERGDVRALAEDREGAIWIGAGNGTVYRYKDRRFLAFHPDDTDGTESVWALLPDADGTIWIGTFRGGLLRLRDGRFSRYTTANGLPSNVICQVLEDDAGQLWLGSYNGVFRLAKAALNGHSVAGVLPLVSYGRSDGLPTLECSGNYQPSAWKGRDGRLWFATPKGVVSVDPREPMNSPAPPVAIVEDVRLDQRTVPASGSISDGQVRLEIPSGSHRLEFQYTGLSFSSPDQVRFRYQLEGLEPTWVDAGTRRSANYSYLPPGTYRFVVAASLGDGRWSTPAASTSFTVLPAMSETAWFRSVVALTALGFVAGAARYVTTRRLRRRLERLEWQRAVERDRGRIARDIHDDLGAGLTQITLLSELARRESPQEMEAHLGQISETARELTQAVDEIVWAVNPRQDTLDGLVNYICQFAQEYLNVAGILCRLDVPGQLPSLPLTADVRHNLFLAVKEALNNIVKHAHAREVWVRLLQDGGTLTLVIEDDGQGFGEGPLNVATLSAPATPGQGLKNLGERLSAIGGRCSISSAPGRGTRVELHVAIA